MQTKKPDKKIERLKGAVGLLKLLAHPVRLSILCNLLHHHELCVGDLVAAEGGRVTQSQISQFLGKMRSEGLVKSRRQAQTVYYRMHNPQAKVVVQKLYEIYCGTC